MIWIQVPDGFGFDTTNDENSEEGEEEQSVINNN